MAQQKEARAPLRLRRRRQAPHTTGLPAPYRPSSRRLGARRPGERGDHRSLRGAHGQLASGALRTGDRVRAEGKPSSTGRVYRAEDRVSLGYFSHPAGGPPPTGTCNRLSTSLAHPPPFLSPIAIRAPRSRRGAPPAMPRGKSLSIPVISPNG